MSKDPSTKLKEFLPSPPVLVCWLVLLVAVVIAYANACTYLVTSWWNNLAEYGHGFVVPLFCIALLWFRRDLILPLPKHWSLWGLAFLLPWAACRFFSAYYFRLTPDPFSLLPGLAGLALLLGGWRALRWAWPSIIFLVFMIPLPDRLALQFRSVLQAMGTKMSVFLIQTLGIPAVVEGGGGNVIQLTEGRLGVEEVCSGLRMLTLFFAICIGVAFIVRRPLWQKIVMVVSAVPIAILANVARITVTAILYELARKWDFIKTEHADKFFHDWAGFFMMPLGLLMLWGVIGLLDRLFIERDTGRPLSLGGSLIPMPSSGRARTAKDSQ